MRDHMTLDSTRPSARRPADADEQFDRRSARIRTIAWRVIAVVLLTIGLTRQTQGSPLGSPVVRATIVYALVLVVLRLAGKRTLGEMTAFDLVILLILSEAVQPALVGEDTTLLNAALIVGTLVGIDVLLAWIKGRSRTLERLLDDVPTVLVDGGTPDAHAMQRCGVELNDIMEAARMSHGLTSIEQVHQAVLERTGGISIIPASSSPGQTD